MSGLAIVDRRARSHVRGRPAVLPVLVLYMVLGDRVSLQLGGAHVPVLALVVVGVTFVAGLQLRPSLSRALVTIAIRSGFVPYLLLQALLPPLALVFLTAPLTALGAMLPVGLAVAGLILGALAAGDEGMRRSLLSTAVPLATTAHAAWAAVQTARIAGLLPSTLADVSLSVDVGRVTGLAAIEVFNRSTGLLANPNALGLWGAASLLFAVQFLDGRRRAACGVTAVFCLVTSGSRGGLVALLAGLTAFGLHTVARRVPILMADRRAVVRAVRISLLCLVPAALAANLQWGRFVEPLVGLSAFADAGTDLGARVVFWKGAWQYLGVRPVGTILTPEYVLGTSIDSDIFRTLAQGGAVFFVALLLGYGTAVVRAASMRASALLGLTVTMVVAGTTMNALLYLPALLFWIALGLAMSPTAPRDRGVS